MTCDNFIQKSFASYVLPDIPIPSLRSDTGFYNMMGDDHVRLAFFSAFISKMRKKVPDFGHGCYVDSTPLPNGGGIMIEIQNLCRRYGIGITAVEALKPVSMTIGSGDQVAVTGASGSGKSTFLHLLGGLDRPTTGSVNCDGFNLGQANDDDLSDFRLRNIGFVFQSYNLLPELTAYENIILPLLADRQQPDKGYLEEVIRQLDLKDRLNHLPGQLSGGQQQRVALARALAHRPKLLLCDEPTGNLDSENADAVVSLLNHTADTYGITLVIVTHNLEIAKLYPRVLTIADGVIGGDLQCG